MPWGHFWDTWGLPRPNGFGHSPEALKLGAPEGALWSDTWPHHRSAQTSLKPKFLHFCYRGKLHQPSGVACQEREGDSCGSLSLHHASEASPLILHPPVCICYGSGQVRPLYVWCFRNQVFVAEDKGWTPSSSLSQPPQSAFFTADSQSMLLLVQMSVE